MKCTNKRLYNRIFVLLLSLTSIVLCGCSGKNFEIPYDTASTVSAYTFDTYNSDSVCTSFASDYCVVASDISVDSVDMSGCSAAGLFDITHNEPIYAKSVNRTQHPASLTKIMTAYLALKYGKLEDVITASANVEKLEANAQTCGFRQGDKVTLDQALHGLLLYSGNDAGILIAEYISGSVEEFAKLMNKEALELGATNTNFVNPHGLTDENHYTTAYDLYLIFKAALKYEKFRDIIHSTDYVMTYHNAEGNEKKLTMYTSNSFLNGNAHSPSNVTVIGGKTGTTKAAGNCLILLSNNSAGESFISVVLQAESKDSLYSQMSELLTLIP